VPSAAQAEGDASLGSVNAADGALVAASGAVRARSSTGVVQSDLIAHTGS
jgi:hypothetical protein